MSDHSPSPDSDPQSNSWRPIVALLVSMLALVVLISSLRSGRFEADSDIAIATSDRSAPASQANPLVGLADRPSEAMSAQPTAEAIASSTVTPTPVVTTAPLPLQDDPLPRVAPAGPPTATPTSIRTPATSSDQGDADDALPGHVAALNESGVRTATPTPEPSPVATPSVAAEPTVELVPTAQPTPSPTTALPTPSPTTVPPTPSPTAEPAATVEPSPTATPEPTAVPTQSAADMELYALGELNKVRARAGLGPLQLNESVSAVARDWSRQIASAGGISHRPASQLAAMLPPGWRAWAENVASAGDIFWAESGLEQSPGHYQNMVNPSYTEVGIGVVIQGGLVWMTQNFVGY